MGRRHVITPYKVFDALSMGANISQASPYTTIDQVDKIGIDIEWTGTSPVGTFSVEVAYLIPGTTTYTTWQALDFGSTIDISGNSGQHSLVIQDPPFQKLRLKYTRTSGTGNLTAVLFATSKGA